MNLLQGRIPKTAFAQHYFRPDFDRDVERIRRLIYGLSLEIGV
jgi:hypothetical protein